MKKCLLLSFTLMTTTLLPESKTWNASIPGNAWNHSDHWSPNGIPGIHDVALFNEIALIPRDEFMVALIAPASVGSIAFNNPNALTGYSIFGMHPLKLDTPSSNTSILIDPKNQSPHFINTPLLLGKDLDLLNQSFAKITFLRSLEGQDKNIAIYGSGEIEFAGPDHNTFSGTTTIRGGKLLLNKNPGIASMSGHLTIDSGSVQYVNERQLLPSATVSLKGSMGNATLDMGSFQDSIDQLILLPSSFQNKVSLKQSGKLSILGDQPNALSLSDHSLIEGSGTLILSGKNTGIAYRGSSKDAQIQTDIHLGGLTRQVHTDANKTGPSLILSGAISNGSLRKTGPGRLLLTGNNTYAKTYIDEGSLQGTTQSLPGDIQNDSALVFAQDFHGTFSSSISGKGSLSKEGNGTVTLSGNNTFTGGILISEGTLEGTTLSLPGPIQNQGALSFNQNFDGTFSKAIKGPGSFHKSGTGTILLTGENILDGCIVVSEGTLIGNAENLQGALLNYASVVLNQEEDGTYLAAISGNGTLIKKGKGTLCLPQKNTHQGVVILDEGAIEISHNESLGSSSLKMKEGTLLTLRPDVEAPNDIHCAGKISYINVPSGESDLLGHLTGGTYVKKGDGILHFEGTGDLTGITVERGSLELGGNLAASKSVVIQPETAFFGTGTLQGDLELQGTLTVGKVIPEYTNPDNEQIVQHFAFDTLYDEQTPLSKDLYLAGDFSQQTVNQKLHIDGNVSLSPDAKIVIKFNPNLLNTMDVQGTLTLDSPTLELVPYEGFYQLEQNYKIIQAESVEGQFGNVVNTFSMLQPSLSYSVEEGSSSILFNLSIRRFSDLFQTGNSNQVAAYLDSLADHPCQNSLIVIETLINTPSAQEVEHALSQMHPSMLTSLAVVQENDLFYLRNAIYTRLQAEQATCRNMKPRASSRPFVSQIDQEEIVFDYAPSPKHSVRLWGAFMGGYTNQQNQSGEPGYFAKSPGAILCADTTIGEKGVFGGGVGYIYTAQDWKKNRGHARLQNIYASLYSQYAGNSGYIAANLSGGYSLYSLDRHISFGPRRIIEANAQSNTQGFQGAFDLKMGLTYPFNSHALSPFVGVDYMVIHLCECEESGARSLNLKLKPHTADLLTTEGGFEWFVCQRKERTFMKAFIRLSAILESRFFGATEDASFVCGGSLNVKGLYPSRVLAGVGAGISAAFNQNTLSFVYQAKTQWQFTDQSLSIDYLWKF